MSIINQLHEALYVPPFHPLVLDDAELINHVNSEIPQKIFEISKRVGHWMRKC